MKKTLVIIIAMFVVSINAWAQEDQKTLFGNNLTTQNLGIMIEPGVHFTQLADQNASFFQIRGGVVFNDKITVGGFFGTLINDPRPASFNNTLPASAHLDSYTAGGFVEYTLFSNKMIHFTFPLSVGLMEIEIDEEGRNFDFNERKTLFIEPRALVEINLHRFARLNAGVGYRFMSSTIQDFPGVPEAGNELTFQIGLKMGLFKFN
ncbi:MAG: hypothetical protein ACFCUU_04065 [Cyclobacteriaceae bacterium]